MLEELINLMIALENAKESCERAKQEIERLKMRADIDKIMRHYEQFSQDLCGIERGE